MSSDDDDELVEIAAAAAGGGAGAAAGANGHISGRKQPRQASFDDADGRRNRTFRGAPPPRMPTNKELAEDLVRKKMHRMAMTREVAIKSAKEESSNMPGLLAALDGMKLQLVHLRL